MGCALLGFIPALAIFFLVGANQNQKIQFGQASNEVSRPTRCAIRREGHHEFLGLDPCPYSTESASWLAIWRESGQRTEFKVGHATNSLINRPDAFDPLRPSVTARFGDHRSG